MILDGSIRDNATVTAKLSDSGEGLEFAPTYEEKDQNTLSESKNDN